MVLNVALLDAAALARAHPDTFAVPAPEVLAALAVGDQIKVAVAGERFWCRIVEPAGDGWIVEVASRLIATGRPGLHLGDRFGPVEPRHVYDVEITGREGASAARG